MRKTNYARMANELFCQGLADRDLCGVSIFFAVLLDWFFFPIKKIDAPRSYAHPAALYKMIFSHYYGVSF